MSCAGGTLYGGRRRTMKKTRKMRGGNFYGGVSDPYLGSAGLRYDAVANAGADPVTGAPVPEMYGGRRRKGKGKGKKTRKGRGSRRRTMRGGANMVGSANSGASFAGKGIGGMADYGGYAANVNGRGGPTQGADGVYRA